MIERRNGIFSDRTCFLYFWAGFFDWRIKWDKRTRATYVVEIGLTGGQGMDDEGALPWLDLTPFYLSASFVLHSF